MGKKAKVFVSVPTDTEVYNTFISPGVRAYLEERFDVRYLPLGRKLLGGEIAEYASDADVILTGWGHCQMDANMLKNTSIRLVAHTGGTVGSLVTQDLYDAGIKVISGNDMYADSVAEGVLAYMLTALRRIPDYIGCIQSGGWKPEGVINEGLLDQTIGIIGFGAISQRVIKLLQPFNVKIKVYSAYPIDADFFKENHAVKTSLDDIFATCKIVSLHSAMCERTRGMIGREHFDLLKDGSIFINTARGRIVKEDEMIEALKENRFHAMLDVYYNEPLGTDHILRSLPNVYCMPHVAGPTIDRRPFITMRLADDIERFVRGEKLQYEISKEYAARMTVGG